MKLLAVFFLLGVALASAVPLFSDDIDSELDEITDELDNEFIIYARGPIVDRLKEKFEKLVEQMKKAFDEGKGVNEDLMKKCQDFYDKLTNLGAEFNEKVKAIFEDLKSKMGKNAPERMDVFNFKDVLSKLREKLQNHEIDIEKMRENVEKLLGKSELTDQFLKMIKEKGDKARTRIIEFIDRILGDKSKQAAFPSIFEKVKEDFERIVERIKTAFDDGKGLDKGLMERAEYFYKKLQDFGIEISDRIKEIFEEMRGKMEKNSVQHAGPIFERMKERIENLINRIKKNFDDGKGVNKDLMKKAQDVMDKFKNLGFELNEKIKQVFEDMKSKMSRTRSVQNMDFNFLDMFKKLKQLIKDNVDADVLKEKVESMFGKGSEIAQQLIEKLKEHGGKHKESILDWIDRILGDKEEKRSIKEIIEKIKDYFRDLNIELKEKFVKFGEYVKDKYHDVVDKTKSDIENVKNIAKKFVKDTSDLSKDLSEEAKEFFRDYKNDLGTIWDDVRDKVREILKKKD